MAKRKLGGTGLRGYAIPKVGFCPQSAESAASAEGLARTFSRRRSAVRALLSSAPKKPSYSSNEQSSSNGESSTSDTIDGAVYRGGFNTDSDDGHKYIVVEADVGDENSSGRFKITAKPESEIYLKSLVQDKAFCNIVTLVSSSSENRISHAVLLQWSKDEDGYSDPAIRFLRMVTSNEIRKRQNHFEQSIQGLLCDNAMTVQKFCEIEVEPMDKDVDNVQIIAFVDALGVPIRIEYVQDSEHKLNHYDFGIEASPLEEPYITLLYRPGHYDILYAKEYHVVVPEPVEVVLKDSEIPKKERVPLTSEMDPSEKDEDMHMTLHTYIRRKRKGEPSRRE